jgi:hypothetical protein
MRDLAWYAYAIPAALLVIVGGPLALGYGVAWALDWLPEWSGDAKWLGYSMLIAGGAWIAAQWYASK